MRVASRFRPGFLGNLAFYIQVCYNPTIIKSEIFRAGCNSLPVVQPTSREVRFGEIPKPTVQSG